MITRRKLLSLSSRARLSFIERRLDEAARAGAGPDLEFLRLALPDLAAEDDSGDHYSVSRAAARLLGLLEPAADRSSIDTSSTDRSILDHAVYHLRHTLAYALGHPPADWDLSLAEGVDEVPPASARPSPIAPPAALSGPPLERVRLYVDGVRSPFNLGSIVRTAAAFGVRQMGLSPETVPSSHRRAVRSAMGGFAFVEVTVASPAEFCLAAGTGREQTVALETGGTPIAIFSFPESGVLIVGAEEEGISAAGRRCAGSVVSIPMPGKRRSLNVGVACGIALHAWYASLATP